MPVIHSSRPSVAARAAAIYRAENPERTHWSWGGASAVASLIIAGLLLYLFVPWSGLLSWAAAEQHAFQNAMAGSLRAIRGGDTFAILTLCAATAAYGFVHALGPGHGKVLLGGVALASEATMRRMTVLTLISSLAQSVSAILLVFVAMGLLGWVAKDIVGWTEAWLAPASAMAVGGIGVLLVVRGARAMLKQKRTQRHNAGCACGHVHGPTLSQIRDLKTKRDALAIVASIAIRPCTGALFLLVIAWRLDVFAIGCLAVLAMGIGTASFNVMVAGSGVVVRRLASLPLDSVALQRFSAGVHIIGGLFIAVTSIVVGLTYLDAPFLLP